MSKPVKISNNYRKVKSDRKLNRLGFVDLYIYVDIINDVWYNNINRTEPPISVTYLPLINHTYETGKSNFTEPHSDVFINIAQNQLGVINE